MNNIVHSKKILLISYHFPPSTAVGGLRIANFAKFLPMFGWEPYVLTIKKNYLNSCDVQRGKELAGIKVFRTPLLPTLIDTYLKIKKIVLSILNRRLITMEELEDAYIRNNPELSQKDKTTCKIKRYVISLLTLPDMERNWVLPAVFRAVKEIKSGKIDYILTSSPPHSVHLIGLLVKILTGVKWVADFRDPWLIERPKRLYVNSALSIRIEKCLEEQVIRKADLVLSTTTMLHKAFQEFYKDEPQGKFLFLSNGFDPEIVSKLEPTKKYEKFTLSYTGTLYLGRSPEPVFKALQELSLEGKINLANICVKLVGNCQYVAGQPISTVINTYGLNHVVDIMEPVPYLSSLEIIKKSHVALLFAPDQPYQIPAKVFDYIGLGASILAITEEGATCDLILSTKTGSAFEPTDIQGIKEFIYHSVNNGKLAMTAQFNEKLSAFDRRQLTKKLVDHLNGIIIGH